MPASMPTRVVAVSWEPSFAEMSAALPLLAKCCVSAARVAPPATPALEARASTTLVQKCKGDRGFEDQHVWDTGPTCDGPGNAAQAGQSQERPWEERAG